MICFASNFNSTGGKSGSAFFSTFDDQFVIKSISEKEFVKFKSFAKGYFLHMVKLYYEK